jgi:hypothetical protein
MNSMMMTGIKIVESGSRFIIKDRNMSSTKTKTTMKRSSESERADGERRSIEETKQS